jgi:HSP20 family protein
MPDSVNADKIEANYTNGILVVSLPKKEEAKPQPVRMIEIA